MVRRLRTPGISVYDIQVEGCANFFANEVLVHNCLIIDDPFKNAEEANSELIREKKFEWFTTAAYTRLEPNGAIILVNTRWHEADISGRLLQQMAEGGEHWTLLHLPALHEGSDVWAKLTLPSDEAQRQAIEEGMDFLSLDDYFRHAPLSV